MPPFDITVKKSELVEDRTYTLTVESQISTGYQWMCLGVLDEKEHEDVAGRHHEYYREVLTKAVMEEAARFGKTMHGITVTPFSMHSGGAAVENRGGANCVGQSEISKASFTVSRDIAEGTYYVVMGYGSAFRGPTITSFKEVRVRVEP
ncbi:chromosome segregation and condensation protein [Babesia caballi]|uniref:Chromosome segregation and condensation protein n=1 Tax=Babesia caballi TaxID=5871 RepID=A0AAV4M049_BABCB|nr:chromosome segregation and condensation protein [Babesia caballi]